MKRSILLSLTFSFIIGIFTVSCKKEQKIIKLGKKCEKGDKCEKGSKCLGGKCEDITGDNPECKYLKKASQSIMEANPKKLLSGVNFKYDKDIISTIPSQAGNIYKAFSKSIGRSECKRIINCELPKLGVGYEWFWTRAAWNATKKIPKGGKKVPQGIVKVVSANTEQASIGEDPKEFPAIKIKQMDDHRIGCRGKVKVRVSDKFSGFVTFHFWKKDKCKFVPAEKGNKDSQPKFECDGTKKLVHPHYTYTVYLSPMSSSELKQRKGKKKDTTFLTGNPGTYLLDVWAYNPINEEKLGMHKQFENETEMKAYPSFKFCPKYTDDKFNNGCGCIGLMENKITISVNPDPFYLSYDEKKCTE
ncbi:MAG: hypothetical protein PF689_09470 [Deltaproteobacteria bacterium]|jgi:hypothetical protein|nr:hypothetical protein [Deltaproteobacteria bacterium]